MKRFKNLNVSVLYYEIRNKATEEHDYVVEQVIEALTTGGHKVHGLSVCRDLSELVEKLNIQKPDIVFNLCETFAGKDIFEMNVTAVLEMLGVRFTGTGPAGMVLRRDKALAKKLLRYYNINCPNYAVLDRNHLEFEGRLRFPLFVKPLKGDASLCIDDFSLVTEYKNLVERVNAIQEELNDAALVEEFIGGREFYVSVLGNNPPGTLPIVEMDFSRMSSDHPRIYGWQAKFQADSAQYDGTDAVVAKDLSPELRSNITKVGREAVEALQVNDYARVDIRITPEGIPYVIEVNANPYLEKTSEFAMAAKETGMDYPSLINRILEIAWKRWDDVSSPKTRRLTRAAIRKRARKTAATCLGLPEPVNNENTK